MAQRRQVVGSPPLGGHGKPVEADETFIGRVEGQKKRRGGTAHKNTVLTLVERGGSARSFHVEGKSVASLQTTTPSATAKTNTFATPTTRSSRRTPSRVTTQSSNAECPALISTAPKSICTVILRNLTSVIATAKLGVTDAMRSDKALQGIVGKRLTYRRSHKTEIN
jgi:hypothetical protein